MAGIAVRLMIRFQACGNHRLQEPSVQGSRVLWANGDVLKNVRYICDKLQGLVLLIEVRRKLWPYELETQRQALQYKRTDGTPYLEKTQHRVRRLYAMRIGRIFHKAARS